MMLPTIASIAIPTILLASIAQAQYDPQLVGTWTTKSKKVLTGPGFYDPVKDKFIEPELTGISYSFTADGWYEEAYYRAISNPTQPSCPSAIMQWQHGKYTLPGNGSILFEPIAVDGRQQTSTPCSYSTSLYIRYNQPELMSKYAVSVDSFHNVQRLDMFQFDGSPMHPMYLEYQPPLMLPTQTLNPTATPSGAGSGATSAPTKLRKRGLGDHFDETDHHLKAPGHEETTKHANYVWWLGIGSIALGTAMYMIPTSV